MIYTTAAGLERYAAILPQLREALALIENAPSLESGRYELGHGSYATIKDGVTKETPSGRFEAHQKYIDIHYLLSGQERIIWNDISEMQVCQAYNPEKDNIFYSGEEGHPLDMKPGEALVCFQEDGHSANNSAGTPGAYRKIVFKLLIKEEQE